MTNDEGSQEIRILKASLSRRSLVVSLKLFSAGAMLSNWHVRKSIVTFLLLFGIFRALASEHGTIGNFAGTGIKGFSGDGGPAINAQLNGPTGIARGPDGALYICDTGNHRLRKVTADGVMHAVAGTGEGGWSGDGGPATSAKLNEPYEVRFDSSGNIFWVERLSHSVRKCDAKTGVISTIAGTGVAGFSGDGGPAVRAALNEP